MGLFDQLFGNSNVTGAGAGPRGNAARSFDVDSSGTDSDWLSRSSAVFSDTIEPYYGSPETMADGGKAAYAEQSFGVALFFFQKSIDMLHTAYGFSNMESRQPSPADAHIVDGYLSALGASRASHPDADYSASVREVTHRLRSISAECERVGASPDLYRNALERIAREAPEVDVSDVLWT